MSLVPWCKTKGSPESIPEKCTIIVYSENFRNRGVNDNEDVDSLRIVLILNHFYRKNTLDEIFI